MHERRSVRSGFAAMRTLEKRCEISSPAWTARMGLR